MHIISNELPEFYEALLVTTQYRQIVESIAKKHTIGTSISWEDAAQTAHAKVWQATQTGKFCKQRAKEFYHWAAKVARNAIIDFIRQEKYKNWPSLDQTHPVLELPLLETIPDRSDFLEEIEYKDLLFRTVEIIKKLDSLYPSRRYLQLWEGLKKGKTQIELAAEFGLNQATVSRKCQEFYKIVAQMLGLFEVENVKQEIRKNRDRKTRRKRSEKKW